MTTSRLLAFVCEQKDVVCLNFTVANWQFNPLGIFEGNCNICSDIPAAGVGNTNVPGSIAAHSRVPLYQSVSLSVFLIMYWQKPGEWPHFTVCQRLHGQCGSKLQPASAQLYKTRLNLDPSQVTWLTEFDLTSSWKNEHSLGSTVVLLLWFVCTLQRLLSFW